jgi:hypothetical protein
MEHDAWFFIGVFAFIFIIWIATGGPLHPISFTGTTLAQPGALGGGTYLTLPRAPYTTTGGTNISLPGSSNGRGGVLYEGSVTPDSLPGGDGGTTFSTASPYRGKVTMNHYVSGAGSVAPNNEYIEIRVAQDAGVPIDLSEWKLVSGASGAAAPIPKGTKVPVSGVINAAQDIILLPGERALVISGKSPIGASFQENKCIGYFSTFQTFSPSLPQNCPAPSDELSRFYGGDYIRDVACIEHVNKISRCEVSLSPPVTVSGSCQSFLVKYLNYNGCVDTHKNDADFMGDAWHIYLGRTTPLWRPRYEVVKLLDVSGKVVDSFSY